MHRRSFSLRHPSAVLAAVVAALAALAALLVVAPHARACAAPPWSSYWAWRGWPVVQLVGRAWGTSYLLSRLKS